MTSAGGYTTPGSATFGMPMSSSWLSSYNPAAGRPGSIGTATAMSPYPHLMKQAPVSELDLNEHLLWKTLAEYGADTLLPRQHAVELVMTWLESEENYCLEIMPLREIAVMEFEKLYLIFNPTPIDNIAPGGEGNMPSFGRFSTRHKLALYGVCMNIDSTMLGTEWGLATFLAILRTIETSVLADIELRTHVELKYAHDKWDTLKRARIKAPKRPYRNIDDALRNECADFGAGADTQQFQKLLDRMYGSIVNVGRDANLKPDICIMAEGSRSQLVHRDTRHLFYLAGQSMVDKVEREGDHALDTYRGMVFVNSRRDIVLDDDPMTQTRFIGQYNNTVSPRAYLEAVGLEGFRSAMQNVAIFDAAEDDYKKISLTEMINKCGRFTKDGKVVKYAENDLKKTTSNQMVWNLTDQATKKEYQRDPLYAVACSDATAVTTFKSQLLNGEDTNDIFIHHEANDFGRTAGNHRTMAVLYKAAGLLDYFRSDWERHLEVTESLCNRNTDIHNAIRRAYDDGSTQASNWDEVSANLDDAQCAIIPYMSKLPAAGVTIISNLLKFGSFAEFTSGFIPLIAWVSWKYAWLFNTENVDAKLFVKCVRQNVPLPFGFSLQRAHITFIMGGLIMTMRGGRVGINAIHNPDQVWSLDGHRKVLHNNYTYYAAAIVTEPRGVRFHPDTTFQKYVGGMNTMLVDLTPKGGNLSSTDVERDLRATEFDPVAREASRQNPCVRCYMVSIDDLENMTNTINRVGTWHQDWRKALQQVETRGDGQHLHYCTALFYGALTRSGWCPTDVKPKRVGRNRGLDQEKQNNGILCRGAFLAYHDGKHSEYHASTGHLKEVYKGVTAVWNGTRGDYDSARILKQGTCRV